MLEGHARFHDQAGLDRTVGPGDLMLMFPRHGYRYAVNPHQRWSEFFVQFRGPLFGLWVKEGLLDPRRPIHHLTPIDQWWKRLEAVIERLDLPEPAQSLARVCRLQQFLVDAVIAPHDVAGADQQRWLTDARAAVADDLGRPPDWDRIGRRFTLSFRQFRRRFTELGGISPGRYRAARVMEQAQELLGNTAASIKDVAARCGFCDEFHFGKRFKALTGLTPVQFRRRLM